MRLRPHFRHFRNPSKTLCVQNPPGLFNSVSITPYYPKRFFLTSRVILHCCPTANSYEVKSRRFLRILIPLSRSKIQTRLRDVRAIIRAGRVVIPLSRSKIQTQFYPHKKLQAVCFSCNPFKQVKNPNSKTYKSSSIRLNRCNPFKQVKNPNYHVFGMFVHILDSCNPFKQVKNPNAFGVDSTTFAVVAGCNPFKQVKNPNGKQWVGTAAIAATL